MRGLPYYEEEWYHEYLLSPERKEIFPPAKILSLISFENMENILDFGMGNGLFLPGLHSSTTDAHIWGAECQEVLIDQTLYRKVNEKLNRFTPFFNEKNEHPLLPEWLPDMDLILCSCVLSTFANPSLAIRGIGRTLTENGRMIIIDWERVEAPSGPEVNQKVSGDRMKYFIEDAGFQVKRELTINSYFYGFEVVLDPTKDVSSTYVARAEF